MSELILTTSEALSELVGIAVQAAVAGLGVAASPGQWMTTREASEYLQLSESRIYEMVRRGEIPYGRVGKSNRFSRQALDQWLVDSVA